MTTQKDLSKQLWHLRRLKNKTQPRSPERVEINRKIREIKKETKLVESELTPSTEKQTLINELERLYREKRKPIFVDFRAYSEYQLQVHLNKVRQNEYW